MTAAKPPAKPNCPHFSSGPCAKRPGWSSSALQGALVGRSHRSAEGKAKLAAVIDRHRALLNIPADYLIAIVPASDTGAIEMAMWSMLGQRGVDVLAWEAFSSDWLKDVTDELKLKDVRSFKAGYGALPDLSQADFSRDVVFVWNGTTSGVCLPNHDWIPDDRDGLTFCDATSAVFAYEMDWSKLDVTTWSWQKVIGGEAAHGMLVLSPRAVERLKSYEPSWPIPKIFRMAKKGQVIEGLFKGDTINTPSMIAVEDCLDALAWVEGVGGQKGTIERSKANLKAIEEWVAQTPWVEFLAEDTATRSRTSICLKIVDPWFTACDDDTQQAHVKALCKKLASENVALDLASYRSAPAGLRIWGGATVETSDVSALLPWLDWAYAETKGMDAKAA
jgi:phosphoserine aminotransferase